MSSRVYKHLTIVLGIRSKVLIKLTTVHWMRLTMSKNVKHDTLEKIRAQYKSSRETWLPADHTRNQLFPLTPTLFPVVSA